MKRVGIVLVGIVAMGLPILPEAKGSDTDNNTDQAKYRWRNDDGTERSATWKAAENTPITGVRRGVSMRLRFAVVNWWWEPITGRLEYAESTTNGPWTAVDASGAGASAFEMMTTPWYADGSFATEQITVPIGPNNPQLQRFMGGVCCELPSNTGITPYPGQGNRNLEYYFRPGAAAKRNTKYYFRLTSAGNTYRTYSKFAQLTMEDTDPGTAPNIVVAPVTIPGGQPWFYQLYVAGTRPMTYNVQGLPSGITRSGTILSGRPTAYGTFPVTVTATNASGSDTKVLTLTVSQPVTEVIVDDQDKVGVRMSQMVPGTQNDSMGLYYWWWDSATTNIAWNGMSLISKSSPGEDTNDVSYPPQIWFRWTPDLPMTAQYDVYARWTSDALRGRNVPYTIGYVGGTNELFVNQRDPALSATWNLLGRYTFNIGTNGWVELGGNDGEACADAVKFVRVTN